MFAYDSKKFYSLFEHISSKHLKFLQNSLFIVLAFFLARAIFFEAAVPFFICFWAIVQARYSMFRLQTMIGGLLGALTLGFGQLLILLLQWLVFEVARRIRFIKLPLPIYVAFAIGFVQLFWQMLSHSFEPPLIVQLYVLYEVLLALVMTIFMQMFFRPLSEMMSGSLSYEKIGAGLFIIGAALTGMDGFVISYFSLPIFLFHLLLCYVAYFSTLTSTILIASIVSAVFHIAKLSFTGMLVVHTLTGILVGICCYMPRVVIALVSLVPSLLFFLYDATLPLDAVYFVSIAIAITIFLLTPAHFLQRELKPKEQPQQSEDAVNLSVVSQLQQFHQFVLFMKDLIYDRFAEQQERSLKKIQPYTTCSSCFRYERCWGEKNNDMATTIQQWFLYKAGNRGLDVLRVEEQLRGKCIKMVKLLEELEDKLYTERLNQQFFYGKKMIALQLRDLSFHIDQLMADLTAPTLQSEPLEERIKQQLSLYDIRCLRVDMLCNQQGAYQIRCVVASHVLHGEQLTIASVLQQLLEEPFFIQSTERQEHPFAQTEVLLRSAIRFQIDYDVYSESKKSFIPSGDSHAVFQLHEGLMGVILSDGVGSSEQAQQESRHLVKMLRNYLTYDLNPETAMHTLHYVLSLKHDASMYATVDFALIDLQYGDLWCWKAGGMMTYILRGEDVIVIESAAAPIGFMPNYAVQTQKVSLLAGDTIIMMSDGIFSSEASWYEQEQLLLQLLRKFARQHQSIAVLLYEALDAYKRSYSLTDDCTVIVMVVNHIQAQWTTPEPVSAYTSR